MEYQQHELKPGIDEYQHRVAQLAAFTPGPNQVPAASTKNVWTQTLSVAINNDCFSAYRLAMTSRQFSVL